MDTPNRGPDRLTISEVARQTGMATSKLRYYEREGLIRSAGRRAGFRLYTPDVLTRLALIDMARLAGFTVREMSQLFNVETGWPETGWHNLVAPKLTELDARIAAAQHAKQMIIHALECPEPNPENCPDFQAKLTRHLKSLSEKARQAA